MIKIAPSLLSADFTRLYDEIRAIETAGADILHLDVMDGHFVPNLTFGLPIIEQISKISSIPLDVHFMVTNPGDYFSSMAEFGVEYVSFHQEAVVHIHRMISVLKENRIKAGIALNPGTPVQHLFPIVAELDFVLLMSVNPGFGGQNFLPLVYDKIRTLKEYTDKIDHKLEIQVDGGVSDINAKELVKLGANILVAGSYIFGSDDYAAKIRSLR
jgi:ribulose-phosphate 3-epimerase